MKSSNCSVETESRYLEGEYRNSETEEFLLLIIELPGGKATYELPISKQQKDSIEMASKVKAK